MLLIDDILLSPVHSFLWIFKEITKTVQQERAKEPKQITAELSDLYMMLETGKITEEEFNSREKVLLDRLDEIEKGGTLLVDDEDEERGDSEGDGKDG